MYFIHITHRISIYSTLRRYMGKRNIAAKMFPSFTGRLFISCFSGWQLLNKQQPTQQVNIFSVLTEHSWCAALGETLDTDPVSSFWHFCVSVSHYTPALGRPAHLFTPVRLRRDAAVFSIGLKTRAVVTWTHPCCSSRAKFCSLWILLPLASGKRWIDKGMQRVGRCWPPPFEPGFKGSVDTPLVFIAYLWNTITVLFGTRCKKKKQY